MSLANQAIPGSKLVANFIDFPVRIGMIYRMDDQQFIPALSFNDVYPEVSLEKWIDAGSPGQLSFSATKDVSIKFHAEVPTQIGQSEVKLSFAKKNMAAGAFRDAVTESLRFENVVAKLKAIWIDNSYIKYRREYVFVYQVVTAASGTLVYSLESKNEVLLKHKMNNPIGSVADLASGEFEYVKNTKKTLEIIRQTAHKPFFGAFRFLKSFEPEILG